MQAHITRTCNGTRLSFIIAPRKITRHVYVALLLKGNSLSEQVPLPMSGKKPLNRDVVTETQPYKCTTPIPWRSGHFSEAQGLILKGSLFSEQAPAQSTAQTGQVALQQAASLAD